MMGLQTSSVTSMGSYPPLERTLPRTTALGGLSVSPMFIGGIGKTVMIRAAPPSNSASLSAADRQRAAHLHEGCLIEASDDLLHGEVDGGDLI